MGKENPVPVYVVKRTSPVTCGCGVLLLFVLIIGMSSSCDKPRQSRVSVTNSTPELTPTPTPYVTPPPVAAPDPSRPIIGLTRAEVIAKFPLAEIPSNQVDPGALKLATDEVLIICYFDQRDVVEGVSFLSSSGYTGNSIDGSGSYVHENIAMLIQASTGGVDLPVKTNTSTKYPVEVHIGNIHEY